MKKAQSGTAVKKTAGSKKVKMATESEKSRHPEIYKSVSGMKAQGGTRVTKKVTKTPRMGNTMLIPGAGLPTSSIGKTYKHGGAVNYKGAASSAGFTGEGTYTPSEKNVGKRISKLKNGGQLPLLHTKPATKNSGDAVARATKSGSASFKPTSKNVGKEISKLKGGGSMGKCKGGC